MTRKARYILIAIGFCLFLILAPLMVLYVRGIVYDFQKNRFVQTGILAIRSQPSSASVSLNGKVVKSSAADIKFLIPQEYDVTISKPGYLPWEKRLPVTEGQVTWVSPPTSFIYLYRSNPKNTVLANDALDFYQQPDSDKLLVLTRNAIVLTSMNDPAQSEIHPLPKPASQLTASADGQQFILNGDVASGTAVTLYFNLGSKNFADLSDLFPEPVSKWQFSNDGRLFALSQNQLYSVNANARQKQLLQNNVLAATFLNNDLYALEKGPTSTELVVGDPAGTDQVIMKGLPVFSSSEISVSFEKQVFILGDRTLYKADARLTPLAQNVSSLNFDSAESSMIFFHDGQLDYFNPFDDTVNLITRRGNKLAGLMLRLGLSDSFFTEDNRVKALELDTRDHQNEFDLYSGDDIKKFSLTGGADKLLVLDGSTLKLLITR